MDNKELFRLASLVGCEPEDEERHRKDLLAYLKDQKLSLLNRVEEALGQNHDLPVSIRNDYTPRCQKMVIEVDAKNELKADLRHHISDMRDKLKTIKDELYGGHNA